MFGGTPAGGMQFGAAHGSAAHVPCSTMLGVSQSSMLRGGLSLWRMFCYGALPHRGGLSRLELLANTGVQSGPRTSLCLGAGHAGHMCHIFACIALEGEGYKWST